MDNITIFDKGNFATGNLIPENPTLEHWALALGITFTRPNGTVVVPPFPVMLWLWNSIKVGMIASAGILVLSTTAAYAFSRMRFRHKNGLLDALLIIRFIITAI